jgi:ATP-dependent Lhr-like helicase
LTTGDDGFKLLHPKVQEQLYRMAWRELRPIQSRSIKHLLTESGHLVISAPTAGGKTEAAFLPIVSRIVDNHSGGVRAVYVSPLKALINDQFRRLEELCDRASVPVHKWHGDVSATAKKALRDNPSGILLITPESIESIFLNYADRLDAIFGRLAFVVIDELHSFLGTERGAHLRSLLTRVVRRSRNPVRLVSLSATFGKGEGMAAAQQWLQIGSGEPVGSIEYTHGGQRRYQVRGYFIPNKPAAHNVGGPLASAEKDSDHDAVDQRLLDDLFALFSGKTGLVFGNSKQRLEMHADILSRHCERLRLPNPFRVHHGSLSKPEREDTEEALRSGRPTVAFCSSTLEMGIDVGNVKLVGQIGPPWGVGSLTQRLGRSGRGEGEASELRMFIEEDEPGPHSSLLDRLFLCILQAIAMSDLLIERWTEPVQDDRLHASTLVQQVMSVIKERGGATADLLFELLVRDGAFRNVGRAFFNDLLADMRAADLLEATAQGDLILGLNGERIASNRNKDFYTAFQTPDEFAVLHDGRRIGSVAVFPATNTDHFLILAGKRWRVLDVNPDRKVILVTPAKGGRLPVFRTSGGPDIHPRVREQMRSVLFGKSDPVYLDATGRRMLESARQAARNANLAHRQFHADGHELYWFTWTGTRIQRTLMAFLRESAKFDVSDGGVALIFDHAEETQVREAIRSFLQNTPTPEALASLIPNKALEKYERFLSEELQAIVFARNCLDVGGARTLVQTLG